MIRPKSQQERDKIYWMIFQLHPWESSLPEDFSRLTAFFIFRWCLNPLKANCNGVRNKKANEETFDKEQKSFSSPPLFCASPSNIKLLLWISWYNSHLKLRQCTMRLELYYSVNVSTVSSVQILKYRIRFYWFFWEFFKWKGKGWQACHFQVMFIKLCDVCQL